MIPRFSAHTIFKALAFSTIFFVLSGSVLVSLKLNKSISEASAIHEAAILSEATYVIFANQLLNPNLYLATDQVKNLIDGSSLIKVCIEITNSNLEKVFSYEKDSACNDNLDREIAKSIYFDDLNNRLAYKISLRYLPKQYLSKFSDIRFNAFNILLVLAFIGLTLVFIILAIRFEYWIFDQLHLIISGKTGLPSLLQGFSISELEEVRQTVQRLQEITQSKAKFEISSQLAHDIRSPLAALKMATSSISSLSLDQRTVILNATNRISDIANGLIRNIKSREAASNNQSNVEPVLIAEILRDLIKEKKVQYENRSLIKFESNITNSSELFSTINPHEFARVVSNLIDNAVEALPGGSGKVNVQASSSDNGNSTKIEISDNGCGISPIHITEIGTRGKTFNKKNGSGLGLAYSKERIETWGGSFSISSELGVGTTITMLLPTCSQPHWFLNRLVISKGATVICIDDDMAIHLAWDQKLSSLQLEKHDVRKIDFYSISDFRKFYALNFADLGNSVFLIDYEFSNSKENGIDLIEVLGIHNDAVIVSGRSDDPSLRSRCDQQKIKLLPKNQIYDFFIEVT